MLERKQSVNWCQTFQGRPDNVKFRKSPSRNNLPVTTPLSPNGSIMLHHGFHRLLTFKKVNVNFFYFISYAFFDQTWTVKLEFLKYCW